MQCAVGNGTLSLAPNPTASCCLLLTSSCHSKDSGVRGYLLHCNVQLQVREHLGPSCSGRCSNKVEPRLVGLHQGPSHMKLSIAPCNG
jgi:hypothetical protein